MNSAVFTDEQKTKLKIILAQVWTGRGRAVEDISKEIHENMFPLSEQQMRNVNSAVEAFVYGGGIQETMEFSKRMTWGLEYIEQKLQQ